jgi:hypothetical protein
VFHGALSIVLKFEIEELSISTLFLRNLIKSKTLIFPSSDCERHAMISSIVRQQPEHKPDF